MATPAITTAMSAIHTGKNETDSHTPTFIQNYWWLRSPYTNFDDVAWYVRSDGVVDYNINNNVRDSHGRIYSAGHDLER